MDTDLTTTTDNVPTSINQASGDLQPHHLTEWQDSSVTGNLTTLNIVSLSGLTTHEYLLYALPNKDRRNDGRLRDKLLQRYQHLEHGGWYVAGLDPDSNWIDVMAWGRFKPDRPRAGTGGKLIKYESPPKTPNRVTYFRVPLAIWREVASRYGIKLYHSPLALRLSARKQPVNFWEWVKDTPEIPILLTEGEKKAGSLLSQGYAAISLPGIWGGRAKSERKELHPDLLPLAQPGRTFIILFDYDQKQSTREAVYKATLATGKAIEDAGCKCKIALLPGAEKGVDDFIIAKGDLASAHLDKIIDNAHSLESYRWFGNPADEDLVQYAPNNPIYVPYLPQSNAIDLDIPRLTAIKSEMATGKTSLVKDYRLDNLDSRFLVIGHRITLLRELSQPSKLNTLMYSDLPAAQLEKVDSLSITVDSLHKLKTAANKYDCIFIDEARQVMNHALSAKTCKSNRHEILMNLWYFIRSAKRVIIADAHLDDNTIDFFKAMRPENEIPLVIQNKYQPRSRDVYYYGGTNSSALVAKLIAAVKQGKRVMVVSDCKKTILKLESVLCEKLGIKNGFGSQVKQVGQKVIWTIHADNSGSEENQNFIKNISTAVEDIDVLLASPSLCTGVDIQGDRFDEVYGFFNAVSLAATDCLQALHRYRHHVPFHIWVAPRPSFGYQDTNAHVIKREILQLEQFNGFLMGVDFETGEKSPINGWAMDAYCQVSAQRNRSLNNLRDHLRRLLARMGYNIISVDSETDDDASSDLKEAARKIDENHASLTTSANKISRYSYLLLKNKAHLTTQEQYEVERFRIEDGYGQQITKDLVKRDRAGAYLSQLIALETVLSAPEGEIIDPVTKVKRPIPPQIVVERDRWEQDNLLFTPDKQHHCTQWLMWQTIGLPAILERLLRGEEYQADDSDLIDLAKTAYRYRNNIKTVLGFYIPDNCSPTWLLGMLIRKLGLKTASRKKGSNGQQVKYYSLAVDELVFATQVLKYRHEQRIKREERKLQQQQDNRFYQTMLQTQYGITNSISTPTSNTNISNKKQGVDMPKNKLPKALDKFQHFIVLLSDLVTSGESVIENLFSRASSVSGVQKILIERLLHIRKLGVVACKS